MLNEKIDYSDVRTESLEISSGSVWLNHLYYNMLEQISIAKEEEVKSIADPRKEALLHVITEK
jgi:hypothetical protein